MAAGKPLCLLVTLALALPVAARPDTATLAEHPRLPIHSIRPGRAIAVHSSAPGAAPGWTITLDEPEARAGYNAVCDPDGNPLPSQLEDLDGSGGPSPGDRIFVASTPPEGMSLARLARAEPPPIARRLQDEPLDVSTPRLQAGFDESGLLALLTARTEQGDTVPLVRRYVTRLCQQSEWVVAEEAADTRFACVGPLRAVVVLRGRLTLDGGARVDCESEFDVRHDRLLVRTRLTCLDETQMAWPVRRSMELDPVGFDRVRWQGHESSLAGGVRGQAAGRPRTRWAIALGPRASLGEFHRATPWLQWYDLRQWGGAHYEQVAFYGWWNDFRNPGETISDETLLAPAAGALEAEPLLAQLDAVVQASGHLAALPVVSDTASQLADTERLIAGLAPTHPGLRARARTLRHLRRRLQRVGRMWERGGHTDALRWADASLAGAPAAMERARREATREIPRRAAERGGQLSRRVEALRARGLLRSPVEFQRLRGLAHAGAAASYAAVGRTTETLREAARAEACFDQGLRLAEKVDGSGLRALAETSPSAGLPVFGVTLDRLSYERWRDRRGEVLAQLERLRDLGLPAVSFGVHWSDVEPAPGEYRIAWLLELFQALERRGIASIPVIGLWTEGFFPQWARERFAGDFARDAEGAPVGGFDAFPIAMERYVGRLPLLDALSRYYAELLPRLARFDHILMWAANNEPAVGLGGYDEHSLASFRGWLCDRYGAIEELNRSWGSACSTFAEAGPPSPAEMETSAAPPGAFYDWILYRTRALGEMNAQITGMIRSHDPRRRPVSPKNLTEGGMWGSGPWGSRYNRFSHDWWAQAEACHEVFMADNYTHGACEVPWMAEGMWSAGGRLPVVWGEAGTCFNLYPCYFSVPTPGQVRWYWDGWGRGLQGAFFFAAEAGDANAYKLFHTDGSPKDSVPLLAGLAAAARAFRGILQGARPVEPQVGIYFARATLIQDHGQAGGFWGAPFQAWLSLFRRGLTVERVSAETLDRLQGLKMLVLPCAACLEAEAVPVLRAWVEAGGTLVAEGALGLGDEHRRAPVAGLQELFGARDGGPAASTMVTVERKAAGLQAGSVVLLRHLTGVRRIVPVEAEPLARFEDGAAAITRHPVGRGVAFWLGFTTDSLPDDPEAAWEEETWGRVFTQHDRRHPLLPRLAVQAGVRADVEMVQGLVNVSPVQTPGSGRALFVSNPCGRPQEIRLRVPDFRGRVAIDLLSGDECGAGEALSFPLAPDQVRVLVGVASMQRGTG